MKWIVHLLPPQYHHRTVLWYHSKKHIEIKMYKRAAGNWKERKGKGWIEGCDDDSNIYLFCGCDSWKWDRKRDFCERERENNEREKEKKSRGKVKWKTEKRPFFPSLRSIMLKLNTKESRRMKNSKNILSWCCVLSWFQFSSFLSWFTKGRERKKDLLAMKSVQLTTHFSECETSQCRGRKSFQVA